MNTALFIDYENIYITFEYFYEKFDTVDKKYKENIIFDLKNKFKNDNIIFSKAYCDLTNKSFDTTILNNLKDQQIQLHHVFAGKNSSDVSLVIDVIKTIYNDKNIFDKYIIVSSDSDMLPVINELKYHGKKVNVVYFKCNTNNDYQRYLESFKDEFFSLEDLLNIPVFNVNDENRYIGNKNDLLRILQLINDIIKEIYDKFYKTQDNKPIAYGTCNKGNLRDKILEKMVVVKADILNGFFIKNMIDTNNIICEYSYQMDKPYKTYLLNKSYLDREQINIRNLVTIEDFQKHIDKN